MILKPSMVVSGKDNPRQAGPDEVAQRTIQCLKRTVPGRRAGHRFPVGWSKRGERDRALECDEQAGPLPWQVSFSYARALQDPALKAWKGEAANVAAAQKIFIIALNDSAARSGSYTKQLEEAA